MGIKGIGGMDFGTPLEGMSGQTGGRTQALRRQIEGVEAQLKKLEEKEGLTKEEMKRKQELERRLAELKSRLSQTEREEKAEKKDGEKEEKEDEEKGTGVDYRV